MSRWIYASAPATALLAVAAFLLGRHALVLGAALDAWRANPIGYAPADGIGWWLSAVACAIGAVLAGAFTYEEFGWR